MKEVLLLLCGIMIGRQLIAQTFSEWFKQNDTQLKYLAAQIAALRGYDGLLEKGYSLGFEGLDSIGSLAIDDLGLHTAHFRALDLPSPAVRESDFVSVIRQYCGLLPGVAANVESLSRGLPSAPYDWPLVGRSMAANLRETAAETLEWVEQLVTDDRYKMGDSGRLTRLNNMSSALCTLYRNSVAMVVEMKSMSVNERL